MFSLLLKSLRMKSMLTPNDIFYVMIDEDTKEFLNEWVDDVRFICMKRPTTLLEGLSWRYRIFEYIPMEDTSYFYMDIDMLCLGEFRITPPPDTLVVLPEGDPTSNNYCGENSPFGPLDHPGFSSGFWILRPGPRTLEVLKSILHAIETHPYSFYSMDQPYFNAMITKESPVICFTPNLVSFNGDELTSETKFINFAGDTGQGHSHLWKMLTFFLDSL